MRGAVLVVVNHTGFMQSKIIGISRKTDIVLLPTSPAIERNIEVKDRLKNHPQYSNQVVTRSPAGAVPSEDC